VITRFDEVVWFETDSTFLTGIGGGEVFPKFFFIFATKKVSSVKR